MASGSPTSLPERTRHPVAAAFELSRLIRRWPTNAAWHPDTRSRPAPPRARAHATIRTSPLARFKKFVVRERSSCAPFLGREVESPQWLRLHDRNWLWFFARYQSHNMDESSPAEATHFPSGDMATPKKGFSCPLRTLAFLITMAFSCGRATVDSDFGGGSICCFEGLTLTAAESSALIGFFTSVRDLEQPFKTNRSDSISKVDVNLRRV